MVRHEAAEAVLGSVLEDKDAISRALTSAFNKGFHAWLNGVTIDYSDPLGYVIHDWHGREMTKEIDNGE